MLLLGSSVVEIPWYAELVCVCDLPTAILDGVCASFPYPIPFVDTAPLDCICRGTPSR